MRSPSELPRVLVVSEGSMSPSHGTGAIFLRNFSAYPPEHLCNAFIGPADGVGTRHFVDLNAARWPHTFTEQLAALPARFSNRLGFARWRALPASRSAIARALAAVPFAPDLIYAVCWGAEGLVTLNAVAAAYPATPVLLHFHDFWPGAAANFEALLQQLGPRITAAWAISPAIAEYVELTTGHACAVEPPFHIELPRVFKNAHRPADPDFRAVLIGNFWNDVLLDDVKRAWRLCQQRLPWLGPVQWYGPADAVARLRAAGIEPGPEVQPMGFLRGDALWSMLAEADLALIPFSRELEPATDYERYSIPSRITELAAAGLPIFGLTGPATPLARYLETRQIGRVAPAADSVSASEKIQELIVDVTLREMLGRRARAVAEAEFSLGDYQRSLYARLATIARGTPA